MDALVVAEDGSIEYCNEQRPSPDSKLCILSDLIYTGRGIQRVQEVLSRTLGHGENGRDIADMQCKRTIVLYDYGFSPQRDIEGEVSVIISDHDTFDPAYLSDIVEKRAGVTLAVEDEQADKDLFRIPGGQHTYFVCLGSGTAQNDVIHLDAKCALLKINIQFTILLRNAINIFGNLLSLLGRWRLARLCKQAFKIAENFKETMTFDNESFSHCFFKKDERIKILINDPVKITCRMFRVRISAASQRIIKCPESAYGKWVI